MPFLFFLGILSMWMTYIDINNHQYYMAGWDIFISILCFICAWLVYKHGSK